MKENLTRSEYVYIASMLFGMFFGAGNLIFPVHMGQLAGSNVWPAIAGFLITGVGLPLLGVAALGISRSRGLFELGSRIGRPYSIFFTCMLYLTIGPFFAIPRCATTSFTVGIENVIPSDANAKLYLFVFSLVFFAIALFFALRPGKIMVWIGKLLNPCFLAFLGILVVVAILNPSISAGEVAPQDSYVTQSFFTGFLEGYNTMDALASLAFGIVVVHVIQGLGITDPDKVARSTVKAGFFSCVLMAVIYIAVTIVGVQSRGLFETSENGGIALAQIAQHYLGSIGLFVLAATVTLACLKTSVGLITSCSETFTELFPNGPTYRVWAIIFSLMSFTFANVGLSAIISYAVPILMFLYPLAITLILLSLFGRVFRYDRVVFVWMTGLTLIAAIHDLIVSLPEGAFLAIGGDRIPDTVLNFLPFSELGLAWLVPALVGFAIGMIFHFAHGNQQAS